MLVYIRYKVRIHPGDACNQYIPSLSSGNAWPPESDKCPEGAHEIVSCMHSFPCGLDPPGTTVSQLDSLDAGLLA